MIPTPLYVQNVCQYALWRRGNKGFARNDKGEYLPGDVHMGYHWDYRCVEFPRLVYSLHIMAPHDIPKWFEWHVDGVKCTDLDDACRRLMQPPQLTLFEYVVLTRIPEDVDSGAAMDMVAGAINPTPNFIDGRWGMASQGIDALIAKGILKNQDGKLVRT